ncbi:hypothetical protein NQ317_004913 [Molorchus minor]|uniref:Uncharacterized protein n=1 Tax=Molorchus minor TaxID=1323400 RepID=A0ABQ9JKJ0_9CUCU|nr:hypothetical protein NQ317_004913 [Molorchus minor]
MSYWCMVADFTVGPRLLCSHRQGRETHITGLATQHLANFSNVATHLNIANFIYKPKFTDLLRNNKDNQDKLAILSSGHNIGSSNHKNYFRDLVRMKWVKFIKTTSEWRHKHAVMEDVQLTPTKVIWSRGMLLYIRVEYRIIIRACSLFPSISQGIMPDLTQGTFEFMEESLNELPRIYVPVSSN